MYGATYRRLNQVTRLAVAAAALCACAAVAVAGEAVEEKPATPPAVAKMLPPDALQLLVFEDIGKTLAAAEKTSLYELWQEAEMKAFVDPVMAKLGDNIKQLEDAVGDFTFADVAEAFQGQAAFSIIRFAFAPPETKSDVDLEVAFMAEVTDQEALTRLLDRARQAIAEGGGGEFQTWEFGPWSFGRLKLDDDRHELGYILSDRAFIVAIGPEGKQLKRIAAAAAGQVGESSLATDPDFLKAVERAGAERDMLLYVNVTEAVKIVREGVRRDEGDEQAKLVDDVLDAMGLSAVRSVSAWDSVDGKGIRSGLFVNAPAPRTGIFDVIAGESVRNEMLRASPASSPFVASIRIAPEKLLPVLREVVTIVEPDQAAQIDQGLEMVKTMSGIDIEKDILEGLGIEWSLFMMPSDVMGPGPLGEAAGLALVARLQKPEAFTKAYNGLMALASMAVASNGQQINERLAADGTAIKFMTAPMGFSPAVALSEQHLVIAPSAGVVDSVLQVLAGEQAEPSIETSDYKQAFGRTRAGPGFLVAYQRPLKSEDLAATLSMAPMASPMVYRAANNRRLPRNIREIIRAVDLSKVPSADTIAKHAIGQIAIGWTDDEGIALAAWGPLGITGGAVAAAGASAAAAAPALARARERAERMRCTERLTLVMKALQGYAENHGGSFPRKLTDLTPDYIVEEELLACPSSGTAYAFVSGLKSTDPSTMIMVYETNANHGVGGNVGTVDGRVTWRSNARWVERQVQRQIERLKAQGRSVDTKQPGATEPAPGAVEEFF